MCFQFLAFSPVRLTTIQLREAISTPAAIGSYLNDDTMVSEDDIASMCGSLVKKSADDTFFEFAHLSVREFLQSTSLAETPGLEFYRISRPESYTLLATQSLTYLQLANFVLDPPNIDNIMKHADIISTRNDEEFSFHRLAASFSLEMAPHADSQSILQHLMNSLFHPSKTSCLVLFATSICFPEIEFCASKGLISEDAQAFRHELVKKLLSDDFRPIHLAAALNLPNVCDYLINKGSDATTRCSFGTPLELSFASFLRFILDGCDLTSLEARHRYLRGVIQTLLSSGAQRNSAVEIFERVSSGELGPNPQPQFENPCILLLICIIAFVQNDFRILQRLLSQGLALKGATYVAVIRELMYQSVGLIQQNGTPLLDFLKHLGTLPGPKSGWQFEIGRVIWSTAVDLGLPFILDPTVTDVRITLSKDALLSKTFATIKGNNLQGLRECLSDGRLDLRARYQHPEHLQSHGEIELLTLLHFAVLEESVEAISLLAKAGCNVAIPSVCGHYRWLPIHDCSNIDIFEELLALGAQVTDVERYTGCNIWHLYGSESGPPTCFFDLIAKKYPFETAKALLAKSKQGHTPLQHQLVPRTSSTRHKDSVETVMGIIEIYHGIVKICEGVMDFWSRHGPLFRLAAEFGSERIIRRLIETGAPSDPVEPSLGTPLHHLRIESSSMSVQLLKPLFPGALDMRFEGQLPVQRYIEKCSRLGRSIEDAVTKQLVSTEILGSIDGRGTTLWKYYCHFSGVNYPAVILAWLLRQQDAMELYERCTKSGGLSLLFARFVIPAKTKLESLIPPNVLAEAIKASCYWKSTKAEPGVLGFLKLTIKTRCYSLIHVLLDHGVSVSEVVDNYSSIQIACRSPLAVLLCSAGEGKKMLRRMLDLTDSLHLNEHDSDGLTILHRLATPSPDVGPLHWLIRMLVTKGVDVNKKAQFGRGLTPIAYHVAQGSLSCAEFLLEMGADPGMAYNRNLDAAMVASYYGYRPFLGQLLAISKLRDSFIEWGRMININLDKVRDGKITSITWLHNANVVHLTCWGGHVDCMAFYVDNKLIDDLEMTSAEGWTAMHVSALQGNPSMIEYLKLNGCKLMPRTVDGVTPLHLAVQQGEFEACRTLVRLGAKDIPDVTGMTPTMHALKSNDKAILELLSEALPSENETPRQVDRISPRGAQKALITALKRTSQFEDIEECKRLYVVCCRTDVSIKGWSPLVPALHNRQVNMAEWLLDSGVDTTACMCQDAVEERCASVIEVCLTHSKLCELLPKLVERCIHDGSGWPLLGDRSLSSAILNGNIEGLSMLLKVMEQRANEIR